jgi:hypothetical protein
VNYRKAPSPTAEVIQLYSPGDVLNFKGFVRGETVNGNNIWLVGALTGGYCWIGAFDNSSVEGLPDLTPATPKPVPAPVTPPVVVAPTPVPAPVVTAPTVPPVTSGGIVSPDGLACVTEWIPAHEDNYQVGNFPEHPEKAVVHQFGAKGIHIGSVINYFKMGLADRQKADPKAGVSSAQFAIEGKRIVQMVKLSDRAYHAGKGGNDFIGIETSPDQDPETIKSVNILLAELAKRGPLTLIKHRDIPGAATECGSLIDLNNYRVPVTTAPPVTAPTAPPVASQSALIASMEEHLAAMEAILSKMKK